MKHNILIGELHWAVRRSSTSNHTLKSLKVVFNRFLTNDYSKEFLHDVFKDFSRSLHSTNTIDNDNFQNYNFVKYPFLNDHFKQKMLNILYMLNLQDSVKFYSCTHNLSNIFSVKKERVICKTNCEFCPLMQQEHFCQLKNLVYCITCSICHKKYIGQTSRTLKARVREHFTIHSSAVYKHFYYWVQLCEYLFSI